MSMSFAVVPFVTGMLAYLMDSLFEGGRRIETPDLAICYRPATDIYHG